MITTMASERKLKKMGKNHTAFSGAAGSMVWGDALKEGGAVGDQRATG